ncbi:MAG: hypothetical protein PF447_02055, partial [Spirochaetaceae bacterium]|nr:hypothetical protein [Spirochaetaceae bacterium]
MKVLCFFIILISLAPLFSQQSPALAVMYLETNASQGSTSVISQDDKDALALAVREMILADLSSMDFLILVEREELERILEEQRLGLSGLLDQETASEAGELLGARYLLTGSLIFTGQAVSLNLKISDTQSGRVESSISKTAHLEQSFILQEEVLEELILRWGLELSQEDRRRLSLRDNPSLQGLIHLGNALDAQNKGDYQKALTYLQAAV